MLHAPKTDLSSLDLRHLRSLGAVARARSFHGAATDLGYTQSAVSQQIAALERAVGHRLLERPGGRRPVELTPVGRVLLEHAEAVFARLRVAATEVEAAAGGAAGTVRVGYFASLGSSLLPIALRRLRLELPDVRIELEERDCDVDLQRLVALGDLDVAFVISPASEPTLDTIELLDDHYVALVREGHPLTRRPVLRAADLAGHELAGFRSCRQQPLVDADLLRLGIEPGVTYRSDDNATLLGLAEAGTACAIVPQMVAAAAGDRRLVSLPLRHLVPPRRIGRVRHRDRTFPAVAAAFADIVREACSGLPDARPAAQPLRVVADAAEAC